MSQNKRRKISFLWNLFTDVGDMFAKCNLCHAKLSYKTSTSNLKRHMETKHPLVPLDSRTNPCNNEYSYGSRSDLNNTPPLASTSIPAEAQRQYRTIVDKKESPASSHRETQAQCDFADDSQSMSLNYSCPQDDHEIFGAFIASELRGLGNNFSLIRSVKKKIQLTLLEAYEQYEMQRSKIKPTSNEDMIIQQSSTQDTHKVKIENTDDDDLNLHESSLSHQKPQQHKNGEYLRMK